MASTDAKPFPEKNVAYRVTFPILDADGDLVTGATGLDSEISKDGGTFADCTNEATEIATSSGVYYLDLTSTEMNADTVAIIVKTSSSGAKTTTLVMYPEEAGDIRVNVTQINSVSASSVTAINANVGTTQPVNFTGTGASALAKSDMVDVAGAAVSTSSAQIGVNVINAAGTAWNSGAIGASTLATDTITASKIAADAIGASELATDAATEIGTAVWATTTRILTANTNLNDLSAAGVRSAVGLASANLDTQLSTISGYIDTEVAAIKAKTDNLPSDPADASDIAASFSTVNSTLSTISGYIDTEVAAIKAKTDNLPGDPADASDIATAFSAVSATLTTIASYIDTEVAAIKAKTDQLAFTTANRVDAQVFGIENAAITAASIAADAITDSKVASDVTIASVTGDIGGNLVGAVGSLAAQAKADVNAEVVDALVTDTYAEPGQEAPASTASLKDKIGYLYKAFRNKITQTNTQYSLYADNGTTVDQKAATSDDGTTFTRAEISSGP